MKRALLLSLSVTLAFAVVGLIPAVSQDKAEPATGKAEAPAPDDAQKMLASLAGEFETTAKAWMGPGAEPMAFTSQSSRKMVLGGTFLRDSYEVKDGPFPHTGEITLGYNPGTKKAMFMHLVGGVPEMRVLECDWDGKGKNLEFKYSASMMQEGKKLDFNSRYYYTLESVDKQKLEVFTAYIGEDGKPKPEQKEVEVNYTRKK